MTTAEGQTDDRADSPVLQNGVTGKEDSALASLPVNTVGLTLVELETILTNKSAGFAAVNRARRFIAINEALASAYHATPHDVIQQPVVNLIGEANWDTVQLCLDRAFEGETLIDIHTCKPKPDEDGVLREHVTSFFPLRADNRIDVVLAVVRDVTAHARAARAVQESELYYRLLADAVPHLVWRVDSNSVLEYANQRWTTYTTGGGKNVRVPSSWLDVVDDVDRSAVETAWDAARDACSSFDMECRLRGGDGTRRWFLVRAVPFSDGETCGWLGTCTDIQDQKTAEDVQRFLFDLGERMRAAATPDAILLEVVTSLGSHLGVNRCNFADLDRSDADAILTVRHEYGMDGVKSIAGRYLLSDMSAELTADLITGRPVVVADALTDARTAYCASYYRDTLDFRSGIIAPIIRNGVQVASLSVVETASPRVWRDDEVDLVRTVAERTWIALDNARHYRRTRREEQRRREFVREILSIVTDGRLRICETVDMLPPSLPVVGPEVTVWRNESLGELRRIALDVTRSRGYTERRCTDLMTAVSEAAMNVLVHAESGRARVCAAGDRVQVWIEDAGSGIAMENLPQATLKRGYSTASTLGHGFKIIIATVDRVYLLTGAAGTTVVLEQDRLEPAPEW